MKNLTKFTLGISTLAAAVLSSFGAIRPVSSNRVFADGEIEEKQLYVDFSLDETFAVNGASSVVKYNDGEEKSVALTLVSDSIYSFSLPYDVLESEEKTFYFSYDYVIEKVPHIYVSESISGSKLAKENYNYVCLNDDEELEKSQIEGFGFYTPKVANPGASYETQRVWLSQGFGGSARELGSQNAVGYYTEESYNVVVMDSVTNTDGVSLFFADIPAASTSISFLEVANQEKHDYVFYNEVEVPSLTYGVCFYLDGNKVAPREVVGADAIILSKVVEAYLTYGTMPSNGSVKSTVASLYQTWFAKMSATKDDLEGVKILDYTGYTANGNSYEGLTKKSEFSVNEKWNGLCNQAGIDPSTGQTRNYSFSLGGIFKKTIALLIGGSVAFVVFLGLFAFFMRRYKLAK